MEHQNLLSGEEAIDCSGDWVTGSYNWAIARMVNDEGTKVVMSS